MAVAKLKFTTYSEIMDAMGNRGSLKLAHNTYAHKRSGGFVYVTYHGNTIAVFGDRTVQLTTAGWSTPSTVGRLTQLAYANGGGTVGIQNGTVVYTDRRGGWKWYPLGKDGVEFNSATGKPVDYSKKWEHNGWSNWDTWSTAATLENVSETVYRMLPKLNKWELRELIKEYRNEIGYSSIKNVNVEELYFSFRNEN